MTTDVRFIPLSSIYVPDKRIRKVDWIAVGTLRLNIYSVGLLQPIVVTQEEDGRYRLIFGEHRYRAFIHNYKEQPERRMLFGTTQVPLLTIPACIMSGDEDFYFQAELAENLYRTELTWQERVQALAKMQELIVEAAPGTTIMQTAKKLADARGTSSETIRQEIARALVISNHMDDPAISKATTKREAWNGVKAKALQALRAEPVELGDTPHEFLEGDCRLILPELYTRFDAIISDPPYGVEANKWDQGTTQHQYDDSEVNAFGIYETILREGLRLTKPQANLFLFCAPQYWNQLFTLATELGWICWPRPIIWVKSNEGMRPHGQAGFAYTYEMLLYATKGGKGLIQTSLDVIQIQRERGDRVHAAQKPVELLKYLINLVCKSGDTILDPCAGSGSIFTAGWQTGVNVTGIEFDPKYAAICRKAVMTRQPIDIPELPTAVIPLPSKELSLEDI